MEKRADVLVYERKLARSRSAAALMIKRGGIKINKEIVSKVSEKYPDDSLIEIISSLPFVGRGGEKLDFALEEFQIDVHNNTALDVGSSTGGFTDCLLKRGAQKVYAVDVGKDQLSKELLSDPRVISMESKDIRDVSLSETVDIVVVDVSFISLEKILPSIRRNLKDSGKLVALIKPQFEVGKEKIEKGGIVKDPILRENALKNVLIYLEKYGFENRGLIESPLRGKEGNIEFLFYGIKKSLSSV